MADRVFLFWFRPAAAATAGYSTIHFIVQTKNRLLPLDRVWTIDAVDC